MAPLPLERCRLCAALLPPALAAAGNTVCPQCSAEAPPYEAASSYGAYSGGLRELIHLLKYHQVRPAAAVLGRMLAEAVRPLELPREIAIVPVPLHASKLRVRGFNQSELIAAEAVRLLSREGLVPALHAQALARRRDTPSQVGMTREQRAANLRGAFAVASPGAIAGRSILLVDDVLTTGATVSECARVLRRAGARKIWVATVARALKQSDTFARFEEGTQEAPLMMAAHG